MEPERLSAGTAPDGGDLCPRIGHEASDQLVLMLVQLMRQARPGRVLRAVVGADEGFRVLSPVDVRGQSAHLPDLGSPPPDPRARDARARWRAGIRARPCGAPGPDRGSQPPWPGLPFRSIGSTASRGLGRQTPAAGPP